MKEGKTYAIITARGGSIGVKRKNVRLLNGKPLIAYTIEAALNCPGIGRCLVSTEDAEIKAVSLKWGAEVIDRPESLAGDMILSHDVVRHVLQTLAEKNDLPDYFVLLQPTSPLRNAVHLKACLESFFKSGANCAIGVTEEEHHPYKDFIVKDGGLFPLIGLENLNQPRQLLPKVYRQNGAIYLMPSKLFLEKNSFFVPPAMPFIMGAEESLDIDKEADIGAAEVSLKKLLPRGGLL